MEGIEIDRLEVTFRERARGRVVLEVRMDLEVVRDREDRRTCWNGSLGGILIRMGKDEVEPALIYLYGRYMSGVALLCVCTECCIEVCEKVKDKDGFSIKEELSQTLYLNRNCRIRHLLL